MKKQLFLLSSICLMLTACEQNNRGGVAADNTGRNVRDRGPTETPGNQSENEIDRTITQKIRQAVMDDDSLSTNAKNAKIITINEVVTLRGAVNNERERNIIAQKARAISGVKHVDNQLEVIQDNRGAPVNDMNDRADMNR